LKAQFWYLPGQIKEITKIFVKLFVVAAELKTDAQIQVGYLIFLLFYVGVKRGLLQEAKNIGRRCWRTGWCRI